jgi:5-methylcytosine-specific restriction endonuclease McrA
MQYLTYQEQLRHPKWKALSEKIKEKADWKCERCESIDLPLIVHHRIYVKGRKAWQYHESLLEVLCENCHEDEHRCTYCGIPFDHKDSECSGADFLCIVCGQEIDQETKELFGNGLCDACGYSAWKNASYG